MKTWNLKETDLFHLLRESNLEPGAGSPLGGLKPSARSAKLAPVEDKPGLVEALSRLTKPEVVLGTVIFSPPEEPEFSWFYGSSKDGNYAFHGPAEDGGHEISWPVDGFLLLRSLQAPLAMEKLAEKEEISLVLDRSGFESLAVLADLVQEKNLLALLRREMPQEATFEEIELLECCDRSRNSQDLRWMVPRALLISPIGLRFSDEALRQGLESLLAGDLLTRRDGVFALTPTLGLACSRLAATSGMSALSTQRLQRLSHFAALRIADLGLWLVEFSDITADEFNVRITSVAQTDMYRRLKAGLRMPENQRSAGPPTPPPREVTSRPEAARKQEPVKEKQAHCPSCGSELRAEARFCAKCGHRLAKKQ